MQFFGSLLRFAFPGLARIALFDVLGCYFYALYPIWGAQLGDFLFAELQG